MKSIFAATVVFGFLNIASSQAADDAKLPSDAQNPVESFGNIYTASTVYEFPSISSNIGISSTLGGKYAFDPRDNSLGFQLDGNVEYSLTNSNLIWAQGTGHVTKTINQDSKIGAFAGIDKTRTASLGFEALTTLSNTTWVQGQVAILDATQTGSIGYGAGASVHQRLGGNWNLRGDLAYNNWPTAGVSAFGAEAAVLYTFDTAPVSIGLSGGYNYLTAANLGLGEYLTSLKVQYSFGGPSDGARGKLFRTNVLGLTP